MSQLTEVRCGACGKKLGMFHGNGEIVCSRCRSKTVFDTISKTSKFDSGDHQVMKNRKTSSGVTFG